MTEYNVTIGAYVRVYGSAKFNAKSDRLAPAKAADLFRSGKLQPQWEDHDWDNIAQPSIVGMTAEGKNDTRDVCEGVDFALTERDGLDLHSAEMRNVLEMVAAGNTEADTLAKLAHDVLVKVKAWKVTP